MWKTSHTDMKLPGVTVWAGSGGKGKTTGAQAQTAFVYINTILAQGSAVLLPYRILDGLTKKKTFDVPTEYDEVTLCFLAVFTQASIVQRLPDFPVAVLDEINELFVNMAPAIKTQMFEIISATGSIATDTSTNNLKELLSNDMVANMASNGILVPSILANGILRRATAQYLVGADHKARKKLMTLAVKIAIYLNRVSIGMSSLRNEKTIIEPGMDFQLIGNDIPTYAVTIPIPKLQKDIHTIVTADPVIIAKALSFCTVLRIGTLNSAFGSHISYANTLKGGLDESVILSVQELNDIASATGGRIIIELKDDFSAGSNSNPYDDDTLQKRVISSSRIGIYIEARGRAKIRVRNYSKDEIQFDEEVTYTLTEIPGVISSENGKPVIVSVTTSKGHIDPWELMKELSMSGKTVVTSKP